MKQIILTIGCLLYTLLASAQNQEVLQEIQNANSKIKNLESHFVQTQTLSAKKTTVSSEGTLYLDTDKMAMHYDAPSTDWLVINGTDFYMKRGNKTKCYNTAKNTTMERLQTTLLCSLHGEPASLVQSNNAALSVSTTPDTYVVTLTSKKKQPRGYATITLTYNRKTKLLMSMQMDEFNGNSTLYTMTDIQTNTDINSSVFDIPEKE